MGSPIEDACKMIRKGKVAEGLTQLEQAPDCPDKSIALAEIAYFTCDLEQAMDHEETGLMGNTDNATKAAPTHMDAYVRAARHTHQIDRATHFINDLTQTKVATARHPHIANMWRTVQAIAFERLSGSTTPRDYRPVKVNTEGPDPDTLIADLKIRYRHLDINDRETGGLVLADILRDGRTDLALDTYLEHSESKIIGCPHLDAARLFQAIGRPDQAKEALIRFTKDWAPHSRVTTQPMRMFQYFDLEPLWTPEFLNRIMHTPKWPWGIQN
ncbi:hypothetical protein I6B53_08215 [Schaalia sp. 19OD2882]|uniref:hypothetical protein n=1 Tax=Schaalia sp. 19OD2882 TaxID=2794089 RepID=UPI001C1E9EF2|nr:hypothetical protein [Schaalia sp. 19OD2882]QWW19098.1 hypothetical protein I6B53_08215 [Schaalia sp. 19OD2882]